MKEKCMNDKPGIKLRCHGGYLWELSGEPQGMRKNTNEPCPLCNPLMGKGGKIPEQLNVNVVKHSPRRI